MSCTGSRYNIELTQGNYYSLCLTVTDSNSSPINLSGYSGYAPIKAAYGFSGVLGHFDINFTTPASGIITLSMDATGTAALPVIQARYELEIYPVNGQTIKYLKGYVDICPELS